MCTYLSRLLMLAFTALVILVCSPRLAQADDTEIYLGQPTTAADGRPNILFIIDTSGSMGGQVQTQEAYDPGTTYDGDCSQGRIYWKNNSSGITGLPVNSSCSLQGDSSATGWVSNSAFVCKTALDVVNVAGYQPVTTTGQWNPTAKKAVNRLWDKLRRSDNASPVDCKADLDLSPVHGNGVLPYAANGSDGPYTSDASQQINWTQSQTSGTYTYYSSNYLNWYYNARLVNKTRLEIVQEVAAKTLDNISNVNVGLMRFDSTSPYQGGMVLHEIADLSTARSALKTQIEALNPQGNTPLSETLYEATLYWQGGTWDYGSYSSPVTSVRTSRTAADASKYLSPVSASCQKNFIVYLTDGEPTEDTSAESKILALPNFKTEIGNACDAIPGTTNTNGRCLDDLAKYLFKVDQDTSQPGLQNVVTYTVGFGGDIQNTAWAIDLLKQTADRGGGTFYEAKDTATLTSVFTNIVQEILAVNTTFTAPTVSVNAFNRTQNLNDLYIAMFGTAQGNAYHWPGNVKRYEILADGTIVGPDPTDPTKKKPVVDPSSGFFLTNARSYWSTINDGADVTLGGAASKIPVPASRNVYTDIAGGVLTSAGNSVNILNLAITEDMLGLPTLSADPTWLELIEWIRGADVDNVDITQRTQPRHVMGDPLHGKPVTVIYGGTATNPDMVLYAVTNDGYLHSIDTATGAEKWAYIPGHLLRRMKDLYENKPQPAKRYALDGDIRVHKIDLNNNGIVDGSDKVYLFFGMGRGGSSYFALDVTNKNSPQLMWRKGAPGEIDANGNAIPLGQEIAGLGQTWSTPVVTEVNINGNKKLVLILGGGYDTTQDDANYHTDSLGNRIYFLDALTGAVLWSAGPTGSGASLERIAMTNSFPADIRVLDLNNDGLADRMYAGDMGGRIWRFDINNGNDVSTLVAGGVFASLGAASGSGGSSPTDARRFYYAPDVSLLKSNGQTFLNIAIGSGYRGHPLNTTIQERFYSLRDYQPFTAKTQAQYDSLVAITNSSANLIDVTTNITPTIPAGSPGWRMDLRLPSWQGEKVLAEARTFQGTILFTSYLPNAGASVPGSNSCVARQGANRLYAVSALDGKPVFNRDGSVGPDGTTDHPDSVQDRWGTLNQTGIAPEAVILFPGPNAPCTGAACSPPPACLVGVEQCGVSFTNNPVRTFWSEQNAD